ncbi:unnamed protein product [Dicrocoelium dendriticum]|nr:unnamed protein product [Dicrocoelium dendriticum]
MLAATVHHGARLPRLERPLVRAKKWLKFVSSIQTGPLSSACNCSSVKTYNLRRFLFANVFTDSEIVCNNFRVIRRPSRNLDTVVTLTSTSYSVSSLRRRVDRVTVSSSYIYSVRDRGRAPCCPSAPLIPTCVSNCDTCSRSTAARKQRFSNPPLPHTPSVFFSARTHLVAAFCVHEVNVQRPTV